MNRVRQVWTLIGSNGAPLESGEPGSLGGHRRSLIFGRLDCPAALRALSKGGYAANRVFFLEAQSACEAGYRPCAVCLPAGYARWKAARALASVRPT
jgi:hypothetical protein